MIVSFCRRAWVLACVVTCGAAVVAPSGAFADATVYKDDNFQLNVAGRLQPRFETDKVPLKTGGMDTQNQFFIRRTRLQVNGKVLKCFFKIHWKLDNVNQIGKTSSAQAEDAYIECPLAGDLLGVRVGLYDMPFSRDLLVSDEKQIATDRGMVSDMPSSLGLADNTYGITLYGKAINHLEYRAGIYDNRTVAQEDQDVPTVAARVDYNFLSSKGVFDDVHWGDDKYLSIGIDGVYGIGTTRPHSTTPAAVPRGFGFDAMVDLPLGPGRIFAAAEINRIYSGPKYLAGQKITTVWMVKAGYLIHDHFEPFIRVDQAHTFSAGKVTEIAEPEIGLDYFMFHHTLQFQLDVMKRFPDTGAAIDRLRLGAQVYF